MFVNRYEIILKWRAALAGKHREGRLQPESRLLVRQAALNGRCVGSRCRADICGSANGYRERSAGRGQVRDRSSPRSSVPGSRVGAVQLRGAPRGHAGV